MDWSDDGLGRLDKPGRHLGLGALGYSSPGSTVLSRSREAQQLRSRVGKATFKKGADKMAPQVEALAMQNS